MNTRDCPGGEEVSIKQISYPVYNKTAKHFYSQILIVLFFAHRRMKSVQMEKAMCVLTLIAIKYVQKPTNWSCTCWHTRERDLTRYVVWATDSLEQSHSMRSNLSLSLFFFFSRKFTLLYQVFGKCLPLWLTSLTHIWGIALRTIES